MPSVVTEVSSKIRCIPIAAAAGALALVAGCAMAPASGDTEYDLGLSDGCHTGREEGFREVHGGVPKTPEVDVERYRDQPAYREAWDVGFWRCYRRVPGMTLTGVAEGPGGAITQAWARGWVDTYLKEMGALAHDGT